MGKATQITSDDPAELKAIIAQMSADLRSYEALVQALRLQVKRLKRQRFGASSEKVKREIEQLELQLEDLELAQALVAGAAGTDESIAEEAGSEKQEVQSASKPRKRGRPNVSEATPRERIVLDPGNDCPDCGGTLRLMGEDVSELLEMITAKLKVVEIARLKKSCRRCEKIVQKPAPSRPIPRSMAGPSLLAFMLVAKFDDHLPLYRQGEMFARMGADIPDSTLVNWCGQAVRLMQPLIELIRKDVLSADRLHTDDTPIKVLDPMRRKISNKPGIKEGRIWAYVRDDRPWGGKTPPGVAYYYSPNRKAEHPKDHLAGFEGILQADAYAGYKAFYLPDAAGKVRMREAACWAHLRRKFHDICVSDKSPIAKEALDQIGRLYDIERRIKGQSAEIRKGVRQEHSKPKVKAFKVWCEAHLSRIPGKGDLAKAMRYGLSRWPAFALFLEDGRVAIDNNAAERAMKPVAIGRKNFLFAGSDAGGETLAGAMTIIETAKFNGHNPEAYLADVIARIGDHKINKLYELLPWNWEPLELDGNANKIAEAA